MNKQLIFFLILAFLFLLKGVVSMNIPMQLAGITLLLLLIYGYFFDYEPNKKYKKIHTTKFNFIGMLGNIDLILGILLIVWVIYGIVPLGLIFFLKPL